MTTTHTRVSMLCEQADLFDDGTVSSSGKAGVYGNCRFKGEIQLNIGMVESGMLEFENHTGHSQQWSPIKGGNQPYRTQPTMVAH